MATEINKVSSNLTENDNGVIIKNATGKDGGFDYINSSERKTVLGVIATGNNYDSISMTSAVSSFGIAFYDFEVFPFVEKGVEFVTAAEGYDSIKSAAENNAPNVEYASSSAGMGYTSYTTNPSLSDSNVSVSFSETTSESVSNSMESTSSYTYGMTAGTSTTLSASIPGIVDAESSMSFEFSTSATIGTAYGTEKSLSKSTTTSSTADVVLPAHTKIGITQQPSSVEMIFDYDCPVYVTYKVAVFGMNGLVSNGILLTNTLGGMCTVFGGETSEDGYTAIENLYNRAVKKRDVVGFEETQKTFTYQANNNLTSCIDWAAVSEASPANGFGKISDSVAWLKNNTPISAAGATISLYSTGVKTSITGIEPLYNLDNVRIDGTGTCNLAIGGSLDLATVITQGYNRYNVPYYGYIPLNGQWDVCDANGNILSSVDGVSLDFVSNYQVLTAEALGEYYIKFSIDENSYKNSDGAYIKNSDLTSVPIIKICVTETGENHNCIAGDWKTTIPATCFMEGTQVQCCKTCGIQMNVQTLEKLEHTAVKITTPATCTSDGVVTEVCGICGTAVSSSTISATGHDEGIWKIDFEATADHCGQMSKYCTVCDGILETKEFELHTHELGYKSIIKSATCTEYGEKGLFCSICNAMFATEQIEKYGHGQSIAVKSILPTCTTAGEEKLYCEDCGMLVGTNEIPATGHTEGVWVTSEFPTCTSEGEKTLLCDTCGEIIDSETIEAKGHDEGVWIASKTPTCTQAGEEIKICTGCESVIDAREIEALGHDEGVWRIDFEATVDHDGQMSRYCSVCDAVLETKEFTTHEHESGYEEVIRPATCTVDGLKGKFCSICNACYETEAIPATGHGGEITLITVQPTCTTDGEKVTYCVDCNMKLKVVTVAATGHDDGVWKIDFEATADHDGQMSRYCSKCGELLETKTFEKHKHKEGYTKVITHTTCTADGEKGIYCSECGACYATETIAKKGHGDTYAVTTILPTCISVGEKTVYCSDCHEAVGTQEIAKTGHDSGVWKVDFEATADHDGQMTKYCSICSAALESKTFTLHEHSYSFWRTNNNGTHSRDCYKCGFTETVNCNYVATVTASTCIEGGYTTNVCSDCRHTYIDAYTDALGHDWSDWKECDESCCHERECERNGCNASESQAHSWSEWKYNEDETLFNNGTKTRSCSDCGATEKAQHTSRFCQIFYPVIVFFGNIVHKIIYLFSLNWLFPELTITPEFQSYNNKADGLCPSALLLHFKSYILSLNTEIYCCISIPFHSIL